MVQSADSSLLDIHIRGYRLKAKKIIQDPHHQNNGLIPQLVVRELQPEDQAEAQEELPSSGHQNCS